MKTVLQFENKSWEGFYVYARDCMDDLVKKHLRKIGVWMQKSETSRFCVCVAVSGSWEFSARFQSFFNFQSSFSLQMKFNL